MRSFRSMSLLVAVTTSLLAGCPRRVPGATFVLDAAARDADASNAAPRTLALAGFHALLVEGKAEKAKARFEAAALKDPAEPYALYGALLVARRQGHPERALAAALDLCERNPQHPLAVAAARLVLDLTGAAIPLDELILQRSTRALERGVPGDTAHLLRSAQASVLAQRSQDPAAHRAVLAAMGTPDRYAVWGPLSAYDVLTFDEALPPEKSGALPAAMPGAFGEVQRRVMTFPDGRFSLAGEGPQGDGYLVGVDFTATAPGLYVVRTVTPSSVKLLLDGTLLFSRRSFERALSTVSARAVKLEAGPHRLLLRLAKEDRAGSLSLSVMRADGKPAQLAFVPAQGPAPRWTGATPSDGEASYPEAKDLQAALREEAGEALAAYIAVRDGLGRDRDGAKRILATLEALSGPALASLRADAALSDRSVPAKVARGRATRELESVLEKDPTDVNALLQSATLALDDGRHVEAAALLRKARAAHTPLGYSAPLLQARVELALGVDAQADQSALEALAAQPGLCDALQLRYDVARRRDAVAGSDELVKALRSCPGSLSREAEHLKMRGDLASASALYERLLQRDGGHVPTASQLASLYVSQRRYPEALKLLQSLKEQWPRNPSIAKRVADVHEFAGRPQEALAAREEALLLDGSDLALRRSVERSKTGKELLADQAIDGKKAIAAYEAQPWTEDAAAAYILDAAAVRAYPDGSSVDRIHIVQKALDQSGVSDVAEVSIPSGAYVLSLRTLKPDGTVLEPENIEGKDTISLPGVQVGDYVEYEYLQANAARGPGQPGFTASSFYFQIARQPNYWSTYRVVAPHGMGLTVDAHNLPPLQTTRAGDDDVFDHDERRVPPYIPEPNSPPSPNEYLPFVSVGAGATGSEGVLAAYADAYLDRGQLTFEVEKFAIDAAAGKQGLDAVRALYEAVMKKLSGRDAGLAVSAAASVAQDRGSRLWLLKAGLEAIGVPARVAAVRTSATDPAAYRFPNEALFPYLCVRAQVPGGQTVWLDPLVRNAPFGELPEQALGEREAYLLPEPGRPLERLKTPARSQRPGKEVALKLTLTAEGKLSGEGTETYSGYDAAQLAEVLEQLSADQRRQALQSALSRYYAGAELSELKLEQAKGPGEPFTLRYRFVSPRFARVEGGRLVVNALTFPAYLGRRFVQSGARKTPLYIDGTEASHTTAEVELPPGYRVLSPVGDVKAAGGPFGHYRRQEKQEGRKLLIDERYRLEQGRVSPKQYDDFQQFAGEVDLIQSRDLSIEKR